MLIITEFKFSANKTNIIKNDKRKYIFIITKPYVKKTN